MTPHAFVAMPFGSKLDADGQPIDFDSVFEKLLKPALAAAGYDVFRADMEQRAGNILSDMFQELLIADLVVADLTIDNPNVWYELGVRHALRARGVILVQGPRKTQAFDLFPDRKLIYHLKNGLPDEDFLKKDRDALVQRVQATDRTYVGYKSSPVYEALPELQEPDWRKLLLVESNEFADAQRSWADRLEIAREQGHPGDILVLADETPNRALWLEAKLTAGDALLRLQRYEFALMQYAEVLKKDPHHKLAGQQKAVCLSCLGRFEEARQWVGQLKQAHPRDAECWALDGRIQKERWIRRWRPPVESTGTAEAAAPSDLREAAAAEDASLKYAIDAYYAAFLQDPSHHESAVHALTLRMVQKHLGGDCDEKVLASLQGGARWACLAAQHRDSSEYAVLASLAQMHLLSQTEDKVEDQYQAAVVAANKDWFALDSALQMLRLLQDLGFRPEATAAALRVVTREIKSATQPFVPRLVLLFAGERVDEPGRTPPRFPADKEEHARLEIEKWLDEVDADAQDLALTQGAAGGDLIFAEACAKRGIPVQFLLPVAEPDFVERSILPSQGGRKWYQRYETLRNQAARSKQVGPPRILPDELGPSPVACDEFARCNRWLLYSALARGSEKLRFGCLLDRSNVNAGGPAHLLDLARHHTAYLNVIETQALGS